MGNPGGPCKQSEVKKAEDALVFVGVGLCPVPNRESVVGQCGLSMFPCGFKPERIQTLYSIVWELKEQTPIPSVQATVFKSFCILFLLVARKPEL